jgi:hypothetical protein
MSVGETRLRKLVREAAGSAEGLFQLLVEGMDWPSPPDLAWEDVHLEWQPEELHLDTDKLATLRRISEIPKFTQKQDFGVFVLDFEGGRLPIGAIRRVVESLVRKQRSRRHGGASPVWRMEDLLFFCLASGKQRAMHVVGFREQDGKRVLRVMSWDKAMTEARLDLVMRRGLPELRWSDDRPALTTDLGTQGGFAGYRESIKSAAILASRMAEVAREVRDELLELYDVETETGPMHVLFREIRSELIADLTPARFADVYAQTMVYGLLTARIAHPEQFGEGDVIPSIEFENPLLNAIYARFREESDEEIDLDELGLADLSAQLAVTDVDSVLADFGARNRRDDPVVFFYEEFLARYDPRQRISAGAFYTPLPVVRYLVRAVDAVLKDTFGMPLGVADAGTWGQVADHLGIGVPKGINRKSRFVSMIDPATGTGTFLVEWVRQAERSFRAVHPKGDWPAHLREVVLPGMHAFEIMLAPYAVAHLRIALVAKEYGVVAPALTILLTDSLDHPSDQHMLGTLDDPVAAEGERAAELKRRARFTVCIGNPPYEREQKVVGDTGKRKGGVVRYGTEGVAALLDAVIAPMRAARLGKHVKNVYNDYIYFWRYATWRATERPTGPGIVAFITASSYLDGVSLGGLRHHMRGAFDELYVVDLGGEGRGARTEENVFDILTPVTIAVGVRSSGCKDCAVRYARVSGTRAEKFEWLDGHDLAEVDFVDVPGKSLDVMTPTSVDDYHAWPEITQLFPWIHSGSQFKRTWPIAPAKSVLEKRWTELLSLRGKAQDDAFRTTGFRGMGVGTDSLVGGRKLPSIRQQKSAPPEKRVRYGYRSFDRQWIFADGRLGDRMRPDLWGVRSNEQIFFTTLTSTKLGRGPVLTATPYVPDLHHFRGSYGARDVMPLWRNSQATEPNLPASLLDTLSEALDLQVSAQDFAAYVHGLAGTGAFAERFADELGEQAGAFHVPMTKDLALFERGVELGRELLWWHTWGERFGDSAQMQGTAVELKEITGMPESFRYEPEEQKLSVGSGRFGPVATEVWDIEVSGLKPLQSWLGYRMSKGKGRKSSPLDEIRPTKWTFTDELLRLLAILEHTVNVTPAAATLLEEIIAGPVFLASELPIPTELERRPPRSS